MPDVDLIVDTLTGAVLVRDPEGMPAGLRSHLAAYLGPGHALACAAPVVLRHVAAAL